MKGLLTTMAVLCVSSMTHAQFTGDYYISPGHSCEPADPGLRASIMAEITTQYGAGTAAEVGALTDPQSGSVGLGISDWDDNPGHHDLTTIAVNPDYEPWLLAIVVMHEYEHIKNIWAYPYNPGTTWLLGPNRKDPTTQRIDPNTADPNPCHACNHLQMHVVSAVAVIDRWCDSPPISRDEFCSTYQAVLDNAAQSFDECSASDCDPKPSGGSHLEMIHAAASSSPCFPQTPSCSEND